MIPSADWLKNTRLCAGGLFLLTLLLFAPATRFEFLTYDDSQYITANEHVKQGLNAETVKWAFTEPHASMWHPLTTLTHLLDVELFGMNPGAHHAVNILIHALNAVLLFTWLLAVFHMPGRALLVAAIFAWHPLRVESVAWVAERKDVMCTLCWLLTLHAYTRYVREPGKGNYLLALGAFALAVMAKPMSVTLPAVLLILDGWPFKRLGVDISAEGWQPDWAVIRQRVVEKIPFFCLSLFLAAITYKMQHEGEVLQMMASTTLADRVGNALVSYVRYLGLLIWPLNLSVLYPHPGRWPVGIELGALATVAGLSYACWHFRRTQPWWLFSWAWFLVTLLPVIGLIQAGGAALANRYTYISTIGLIIAGVWSLAEWAASNPAARRKEAGILAVAVTMGCMVLTLATLPLWRDTETLFRQTTRTTQSNAIAHLVLSEALLEKKKPQEALEEISKAIILTPTDAKLHLQAGRVCLDLNQPELAIEALQNARKFNPKLDGVGFQLARAFRRVGRNDEAKALLLQHLERHPRDGNAWNNLGGIQAEQRDVAGAEKSFQNALAKDPASLEPRRNLIRLLAVSGRPKEAMVQIQTGLKYHPDNAELWFQSGLFHEEAGQIARARSDFETAAKLATDWALPKESLAWLLVLQPQISPADARQSLGLVNEILNLYGAEAPLRVRELQACVLAANGKFPEAIEAGTKTRDAFLQAKDQRGVARLEAQLAAYQSGRRWLPSQR